MHFLKLAYLFFQVYDGLEWPSTALWSRKRFYSMMQFPTVTVLHMTGINGFPAAAFQPCIQLIHLVVHGCTFNAEIDADEERALPLSVSADSNKHGCLQILDYNTPIVGSTIGQLIDALSDPSSLLSVMHLRKLAASVVDDSSYIDCQRILELTSPYL
ncbi:hypothetical protein H2248_004393 [Termitomyces sp. 'cryptogamus']|nr:hypothetical protein H2248_004393 [Termitomyces sp. 'cryptogamus']